MINAFQHVGMGVWDVEKTFSFYKNFFGFKVKLNDITAALKELEPVLGKVETMRILMAVNVRGGGIVEFIEYKSTPIQALPDDFGYGYHGILEIGIRVKSIEIVIENLKSRGVQFLTPLHVLDLGNGLQWRYAYLQDPDGLRIQLVEEVKADEFRQEKPEIHGVLHVGIGVSDMARSISFYKDILGYDRTLFSFNGHMPEMDLVTGQPIEMKMVILERSQPVTGPITTLDSGIIKLFEVPGNKGKHVFEGRRWGDVGCMELSMDVSDLRETVEALKARNVDIYLPAVDINMGSGSKGKVAYIRDPDGTTIEFVEIETVAWLSASLFMKIAMPLMKIYDWLT